MSESYLASGTAVIAAGERRISVNPGITDPLFKPVICVTPFGENANVNVNLSTAVLFTGGEWSFEINRNLWHNTEAQSFFWNVIAMKTVPEIGPTVTPASES